MDKFYLETILTKTININIYFENIIIELYVLYLLNVHVKFHSNRMLIII